MKNLNTPTTNKLNKLAQYTQIPQDINIKITQPNYLSFLAGFFEGEGCLSIGISVSAKHPYGVSLVPYFGVYQHVNGIELLQSFWVLSEGKGTLHPKYGSPLVWTYELKSIKNIIKYVIPYIHTYVFPFSCKTNEFLTFEHIVLAMEKKEHLDKNLLCWAKN